MKKLRETVLLSVTVLGLVFAVGFAVAGCTPEKNVAAEEYAPWLQQVRSQGDFIEFRDTETGVHYYLYVQEESVHRGIGVGASLCPRYNADGSLYVD